MLIDPDTSAVQRIIALQYNPDTLTRSLQPQAVKESGDRSEALRLTGPPVETIKLDAEIDATDQLEFPDQNANAVQLRHPAAAGRARDDRLSDQRAAASSNNALPRAGMLEIVPMISVADAVRLEPATASCRCASPTSASPRKRSTPTLNPIRAKVSLGMRVLSVNDLGFDNKGGEPLHGLSAAEGAARREESRRHARPARHRRDPMMRSATGPAGDVAAGRAEAPRLFPPNSRYHGIDTATLTTPDGRDDRVSAPALRAAAGRALAAAGAHGDRRRAARRPRRASYLGDPEQFWRLCDAQRRDAPEELTETSRRRSATSRCRTASPGRRPMLKGVTLQLYVGPLIPLPAPQRRDRGADRRHGHGDTRRRAERLSAVVHASARSRRCTRCSCSPAAARSIILRVVIVVDVERDAARPHGRRRHQSSDSARPRCADTRRCRSPARTSSVLMDKIDFSGFPFPAMPAEGRVALLLLQVRGARHRAAGRPQRPHRHPDPDDAHSVPAGHRPRLHHASSPTTSATSSTSSPGPVPGMNVAYWGPQIKVGVPQPALNINMDAHTNVESLSFAFDNNLNAIPTVFYYDEITKAVIPIPIPPITPLNPPLGLIPPIPTRLAAGQRRAVEAVAAAGDHDRAREGGAWAEAVSGNGELDVLRYGAILKARQLVGVRGAGTAFDGLYYVKSVTHKIKRGEYKQSFELTPQRARSPRLHGWRHEGRRTRTRYYGKYRGTVVNNIDPEQRGRIRRSCRTSRGSCRRRGRCRACRSRASRKDCSWCRRSAPASGSSSSRAIRTIRSGSAASGERSPKCRPPALAPPPIPPGQTIVLQTTLQHSVMISDAPADSGAGADSRARAAGHRRHRAPQSDRRDDRRQRHRHLHQQRQGRVDRS